MLNFSSFNIDDINWAAPIFQNSGYCGADNTFASSYIWQRAYDLKVCYHDGFLFRRYGVKDYIYGFPLGNKDINLAIETLIKNDQGKGLKFIGLTRAMVAEIEKAMPEKFIFSENRDAEDYLYNALDLIELQGKKYHSKRNHISKFKKLYNWTYEEISMKNIDDCKQLISQWCIENNCKENEFGINEEIYALNIALDFFDKLNFIGGIIKVDNIPVALTLGEEINKEVFVVHFEKALSSYKGAYNIINNEFAKRNLKEYKYINREEDMGLEGLRKAKLSYYPSLLLEKYTAVLKD